MTTEAKTKKIESDYNVRQIMALNRAIQRVRDVNLMTGASIPGCTLPTSIMFLNAWTQKEIKNVIEGADEAIEALRKKHGPGKDEKGKEKKWKDEAREKFDKDVEKLMDAPAELGVELKKFSMKELSKLDTDEYLKKCNEKHPVPQEYFSLLMEAGLLDDDLDD